MDISLIVSLCAIGGFIITIATTNWSRTKEARQESAIQTEMRDDIKYLREKMDELTQNHKNLEQTTHAHATLLGQHETRISALEHWRERMEEGQAHGSIKNQR